MANRLSAAARSQRACRFPASPPTCVSDPSPQTSHTEKVTSGHDHLLTDDPLVVHYGG